MKVIIAKTAGFCMGVDLALNKLDRELEHPTSYGHIYTSGPIIHNPQVLGHYQSLGVRMADDASRLSDQDTLVIRAHGIPRFLQKSFENKGVRLIDATCPKVKKAQILIQREAEKGKHLLLFGEKEHPEVTGLVSYAQQSSIFGSFEELSMKRPQPGTVYFLAAQTTQDKEAFTKIRYFLRGFDPDLTVLDTICTATHDRQDEVRDLARRVEAIVVVGGKNSGNTRRLFQIATESARFAVHVEEAGDLPLDQLRRFHSIAVTAGASTPAPIIHEVVAALRSIAN